MTIDSIVNRIIESKKIGITCHTSPDGDSLGSVLGLLQGLLKLGKEAYVMSKDPLPETFRYMPFSNEIVKNINSVLEGTDTVIVLDCGNIDRINSNLDLNYREYVLLNIDHHISNDMYGDINYVDTSSAAVAEIIFFILKLLNVEIDANIATCLYTSLITDTGSFRHSNTTKLTHEIAGNLIDTGINFTEIHRVIFENKQFNRVKLYGRVIQDMKLVLNSKVCIMKITDALLNELNIGKGDTSDILTFGTQINSVEVTILLKESEDGLNVSLRSKNAIDVRKLSEEFGGGGHTRAAGFSINKPLREIEQILINKLEKELM